MKKNWIFILIIGLVLISCSEKKHHDSHDESVMKSEAMHNDKNGHHTDDEKHSNEMMSETKMMKSDLSVGIVNAYMNLKNALVKDDRDMAADAGQKVVDAFSNFDNSKLKEDQRKEYSEIAENAIEQGEHIAKSDIGHQREHFVTLSNDVYDLIKLVGTNKHLYKDYCSMYKKGKGAHWLSETKTIENPYYGAKMLNCGEIKEEINK